MVVFCISLTARVPTDQCTPHTFVFGSNSHVPPPTPPVASSPRIVGPPPLVIGPRFSPVAVALTFVVPSPRCRVRTMFSIGRALILDLTVRMNLPMNNQPRSGRTPRRRSYEACYSPPFLSTLITGFTVNGNPIGLATPLSDGFAT
jgi:hypothetical protein